MDLEEQKLMNDEEMSKYINSISLNSKYTELISSLPIRNDYWKLMDLHHYKGFWYFSNYLEALLKAQQTFKAQPSDIFICSFPKTGATWLKALAFTILTHSRFNLSNTSLLSSTPHDCVPFLEIEAYNNNNNANKQHNVPDLLATHIPYTCLPNSITDQSVNCKIVYICRDPKDVLVSLWHFLRANLPPGIDKAAFVTMEHFFELFCEGAVNIEPYWDHVLGYWKASLEFPDKVLFLVYEDVKKDIVSVAKKLGDFMGCGFSLEEERRDLVQNIVDFCSFENLSGLKVSQSGVYSPNSPIQNSTFYGKSKSGGWTNYLTQEMGSHLDQIVEQKLSGSGFSFLKSKDD